MLRGGGLTCAIAAVAVVLTAATDEGGVAWGERVARVVPIIPVCAAVAAALALAGPRQRGEGRALEALGRSPFATAAAAAIGAGAMGALAAVLIVVEPRIPVGVFFPTAHTQAAFTYDRGVFTTARFRVLSDGSIDLAAATPDGGPLASGLAGQRGLAALVTAVGSAGFVLTVALIRRAVLLRAVGLLAVTAVASAACLQGVAAGRLPSAAVPVPSTLLFLAAVWVIVRQTWQARQTQTLSSASRR